MRNAILTPVLSLLLAFSPTPTVAQEGAPESPWSMEAEMGASVFFGNTSQTAFTSRWSTERADSVLEFDGGIRFSYGEASNDLGDTFVNKRTWIANIGVDWMPFARVTPFAFGSLESSHERKIASRISGGAGAKVVIRRDDGRVERLDLSLALLAERTKPLVVDSLTQEITTIGRWSARFRYRISTEDGRLGLSTIAWYRPELTRFGNYSADLESVLDIVLTQSLSLKIGLIDRFDSSARDRGARSNNDGQLTFGLGKTF